MASTGPRDQRPQGRPAVSRWMVAAGVGVLLVAAAITVATVAPWEQGRGARSELRRDGQVGARSLPGVPLRSPAGLRLLVANDPEPFVLDLDSRVTRPVIGLPADDDRSVHVESVGEDAVVVSRRDCQSSPPGMVGVSGCWLGRTAPTAPWVRSGWTASHDDPRGRCHARRSSSTTFPPGCWSMSVDHPAVLVPTARWSPPMAPSAGSQRWWMGWPEGTWC